MEWVFPSGNEPVHTTPSPLACVVRLHQSSVRRASCVEPWRFERCPFDIGHCFDIYTRAGAISVAVIVAIFLGLAILEFSPGKKPIPPFLPDISACGKLGSGMRRIGGPVDFQFDVSERDFTISESCSDALPIVCGFHIRPNDGTASLGISWGGETTDLRPPDPILGPPENIETHRILDDQRKPIGRESWGYWGQGERWRRVHLLGRIQARYGSQYEKDVPSHGSVHERDAARFDAIMNSAAPTARSWRLWMKASPVRTSFRVSGRPNPSETPSEGSAPGQKRLPVLVVLHRRR